MPDRSTPASVSTRAGARGRGVSTRCSVLGVGNVLRRDEGVGVHLLRSLQRSLGPSCDDVDFVDGGTLGLRLLGVIEGSTHLLLLDAVDAGEPPGTVLDLGAEALTAPDGVVLSMHETSLAELLTLALARDALPAHLRMVGVQVGTVSMGLELSAAVARALPLAVEIAESVLAEWNIGARPLTERSDAD